MEKKLRQEPVTRRGKERVERILDAADSLVAELGYEEVTTNAIAARAQTSIGSLYRVFPDKEAVVQALATRYRDRLHILHDRVLTTDTAKLPLPEIFDRIIRALADFHRTNPGFQPLFYGSPRSAGLTQACQLLHEECIGRVDAMLAFRHPDMDPDHRRLLARINFEVTRALLPLSESSDESFRERVLGEVKAVLLAYMRQTTGDQT